MILFVVPSVFSIHFYPLAESCVPLLLSSVAFYHGYKYASLLSVPEFYFFRFEMTICANGIPL
jgi:hypothetical protein